MTRRNLIAAVVSVVLVGVVVVVVWFWLPQIVNPFGPVVQQARNVKMVAANLQTNAFERGLLKLPPTGPNDTRGDQSMFIIAMGLDRLNYQIRNRVPDETKRQAAMAEVAAAKAVMTEFAPKRAAALAKNALAAPKGFIPYTTAIQTHLDDLIAGLHK